MRLIYHPDAETELIEAAQFYEQRVSALGAQFLDAVDQAIRTVADAPERWRVIDADVRRYLMPRFPYAIYYRVASDHIRILLSNITGGIRTTCVTVLPNRHIEDRSLLGLSCRLSVASRACCGSYLLPDASRVTG